MTDNFLRWWLGGVIGYWLAIMIFGVFGDYDKPEDHYNQNVCQFLGGQMHDDVCVVNGRVVDIKTAKPQIQEGS